MLEIVSGKRNRGFNHLDGNLNLLEHESITQYLSISMYKRSVDYLYNGLGMDTFYRR